RYAIMSDYLPTRGGHALDMMHATATVQANFDFCDETDMIQKMRTAMGCTAITSAIFSNSPISEGRPNGFVSKRVRIWRDVDPDRCGFLPFVFDPDFGYAQYAEWALDVPMFFVVRDHEYKPAAGMTFRQFYENGFEGARATLGDWDLHLTTVFPEIRLKRYIEVRGTDCVPSDLICAVPALWKGLLYDAEACNAAWELVRGWSDADREDGLDTASAHGLGGSVAGRSMLAWAKDLVAIARDGLGRLATPETGDERSFLDPIDEVLARGQSPGEVLLARWNGDWAGSMERLIDFARY
ncbi:MAG: glutamate--cysteine ligase, partial [bacterium]|nr:glutamate--cysteine ligase [bacterium]